MVYETLYRWSEESCTQSCSRVENSATINLLLTQATLSSGFFIGKTMPIITLGADHNDTTARFKRTVMEAFPCGVSEAYSLFHYKPRSYNWLIWLLIGLAFGLVVIIENYPNLIIGM